MDNLKISLGFLISLALVFYSFTFSKDEKIEIILSENLIPEKNTSKFSKFAEWQDYDRLSYSDTVKIYKEDYISSIVNKNNLDPKSWSDLYLKLSIEDDNKLNLISSMLFNLKRENNLNPDEFAKLIVSFVQHIPYSLIVGRSCKEASKNKSIKNMIKNGVNCEGNIFAGIYTPMEFMKNFKGDCDTRTVFLYTLMKNIGYDVVIMNSKQYAHSILGIRIAASGKYKKYKGKKYYVWETTNSGWRVGNIPPKYNKLENWNIIL